MTVETETVQSIPQSGLTAGDRSLGLRNEAGSVRLKPSTETIRPRKERKKVDRKARSINQGTGMLEARYATFPFFQILQKINPLQHRRISGVFGSL
jgi:hypothetical protein